MSGEVIGDWGATLGTISRMKFLRQFTRVVLLCLSGLVAIGCIRNFRPLIKGQVIDAETGAPVPNAMATVGFVDFFPPEPRWETNDSIQASCRTNAKGNFVLKARQGLGLVVEPADIYRVHVNADGYSETVLDFVHYVDVSILIAQKDVGRIAIIRSKPKYATTGHER